MRARPLRPATIMGLFCWAAWAIAPLARSQEATSKEDSPAPATFRVAAVQMRSARDLAANLAKIKEHLARLAKDGVRLAVFPECSVTGYFDADYMKGFSQEQLADAQRQVADACREQKIGAVVGLPWRDGDKLYNSAVVIDAQGRVVERYHKIQLAESWPDAGDHLSVFRVDGVPCSIIICHDERYPELVRLPVLAGARVVFYVSHESDLKKEKKIEPYRAQIQARAVENNVYVVQANAPANDDLSGSHGQSRIIAPDGNLVAEATIFEEEALVATLELERATGRLAEQSVVRGPLGEWWREGSKKVRIISEPSLADGRNIQPPSDGSGVRVAGIVLKWIRGDKEANYNRAAAMVREAAANGAKIVCTTECFLDGYAIADTSIPLETYRELGEPIPDGKYFQKLAALADELDIHLLAGMLEADGPSRFNAAVLLGPNGQLVGKYRKQKLGHESVRNLAGDESKVFDTPYGRIGVMICADRTEPDIVDRYRQANADFLLCPSGGMFGPAKNDPIVMARSRETKLPIVFVHPAEFLATNQDGELAARTLLGDRLLIASDEIGRQADQNRIVYFELPKK